MSSITDVMISVPSWQGMKEINTWLEHRNGSYPNFGFGGRAQGHGGDKTWTDTIYFGSFNGFNMKSFLEFLATLEWEWAEATQVFYKHEEHERFAVWSPPYTGQSREGDLP